MKDVKLFILIFIAIIITLSIVIFPIHIVEQNTYLKKHLEFYENESLREGIILWFDDTVVLVYDTFKEAIIEVDIYDELIYTNIEVGDTAIYVVDYDYIDADLINIIKQDKNKN